MSPRFRQLLGLLAFAAWAPMASATFSFSWNAPASAANSTPYAVSCDIFFSPDVSYDDGFSVNFYCNSGYVTSSSGSSYDTASVGGSFSHSGPQTVSFMAEASSYQGEYDTSYASVSISGPNSPPSASISGSQNLLVGESGSWDFAGSDSNNNLYRWRFYAGTNSNPQWSYISGGSVSGSYSTSFSSPGAYTWNVDVEDESHATDSASITVSVKAPVTFSFSNLSHTYDGSTKSASVSASPAGATYSANLTAGPGAGSYTVTATGTGDYVGSGSATLTIDPIAASFSLNSTSFTYNGGSQGPTVLVSPSAASSSMTTGGTLSAVNPGTYTATASVSGNYSGSNNSLTWSISDPSTPVSFTFGNLSQTYDGSTKTATVTPSPANATYTTSLTSGSPNAGSYTVTATGTGNYSGSGAATLVINPIPVTFSLSTTSFAYTGSNQGPTVVPNPSAAAGSMTTGGALLASAVGNYTATATASGNYSGTNNSLGWSITATMPVITSAPGNRTRSVGQSNSFTVTASSSYSLSYQWYKNGAAISGANSDTYTIASVQTSDAGSYTVRVSNVGGYVDTSPATLTVVTRVDPYVAFPLVAPIQAQLSEEILVGGTVIDNDGDLATATAKWDGTTKQQWSGLNTMMADRYTLMTVTGTADQYSTFRMEVTDSANGFGFLEVPVKVLGSNSPPETTNVVVSSSSSTQVQLSATATDSDGNLKYINFYQSSPPNYNGWYLIGSATVSGASATGTFTWQPSPALEAGTYQILALAEDTQGAVDGSGAATSFTLGSAPSVWLNASQIPAGNNVVVNFSGTSAGNTIGLYRFNDPDTSPLASVAVPASGNTVTFSTTGLAFGVAYHVRLFSATVGTSTKLATSGTFTLSENWTLTVQNGTGSGTGLQSNPLYPVSITANPPPSGQYFAGWVVLSGPGRIGDPASASTVFSIDGGDAVVKATYGIPAAPVIVVPPDSTTQTLGLSVAFRVVATGVPPPVYQWFKNGVAIQGATRSIFVLNSVQASDAGSYTVQVSNVSGAVLSTPAVLTVDSSQTYAALGVSPTWSAVAPGATTVVWSAAGATSVSVSGPGLSSTAANGSQKVSGLGVGVHTYTLTASGPGGTAVRTAKFTVAPLTTPGSDGTPLAAALPDSVSVDNRGAANQTIPLEAPVGRGGMQPALSVNYSSLGGNGPVGVGYSLVTGFPQAISRGRTILARDGVARGVVFDNTKDKLYLDGRRLICTSGIYGAPGSVYRTEIDSFATITATGSGSEIDGFRLQGKDGVMMCFGKNVTDASGAAVVTSSDGYHMPAGEAQKASSWALKWVEDATGNYIDFRYDETDVDSDGTPDFTLAAGEHLLTSIRYTGNRRLGITPGFTAWLRYNNPANRSGFPANAPRPDERREYQAGRYTTMAARLDDICFVTGNGFSTPPRSYRFRYDNQVTGPASLRLVEVLRKEGTGSTASTVATQITWGAAASSLSSPGNTFDPGTGYRTTANLVGDFNGDGRPDIFFFTAFNSSLKFVSRDASGAWVTTPVSVPQVADKILIATGDFDGDGRTDLVWEKGGPGSAQGGTGGGWYVTLSQPEVAGQPHTFSQPWLISPNFIAEFPVKDKINPVSAMAVDLDGDGKDELLFQVSEQEITPYVSWLTDDDDQPSGLDAIFGSVHIDSMCVLKPNGAVFAARPIFVDGVLVSTSDISLPTLKSTDTDESMALRRVDLDGDGRSDFIATGVKSSSSGGGADMSWNLWAFRNTDGVTFSRGSQIATGSGNLGNTSGFESSAYFSLVGDVNGDGLDDFVYLLRDKDNPSVNRGWVVALSKGDGTFDDSFAGVPDTITIDGTARKSFTQRPGQVTVEEIDPRLDPKGSHYQITFVDGFEISGALLLDYNGDGRKDLVVYIVGVGWRCFLAGRTGFDVDNPIPLLGAAQDSAETYFQNTGYETTSGFRFDAIPMDVDGKGFESVVLLNRNVTYQPQASGFTVTLASASRSDPYRVIGVTNGLGAQTTVGYDSISNDTIYTSGAAVKYPIRETRHATVVTDLKRDSGGTFPNQAQQFSYQYSGARVDVSGRGFLGFHSFVTLDQQTQLFKYQFLAQSFPMTGLVHREETYRYLGSGGFRFLSSHDNTVVFDAVNGGNGSLWPFISQAVESRWEDSNTPHFTLSATGPSSQSEGLFAQTKPPGAHITITAQSRFDNQASPQLTLPAVTGYFASDLNGTANVVAGTTTVGSTFSSLPTAVTYGNLKQLTTDFGGGFTETVTTTYKPVTSNGLSGLVDTVTTTVSSPGFGAETAPTKSFTYATIAGTSTPLVATETSDAADNKLDLTTTYDRTSDPRGRMTNVSISGYNSSGDPQHVGAYSMSSVATFDDRFDLPRITKNAEPYQHATTTEYDPLFALPTSVTDVNGAQTTTAYDPLGRTVQVLDVLKGLETDTTYTLNSSQVVTPPTGVTALTQTSAFAVTTTTTVQPAIVAYHDRLGRIIRTIKSGFNSQQTVTDTVYNDKGQVVAVSNPYPSGGTKYWTITTYDALGRVATVTAPNGTVTTNTYNGRLTTVSVDAPNLGGSDPAPQANSTLVDAKGRTVKVWNADNPNGGVSGIDGTGGNTPSVAFDLDGFGRMRTTTLLGQSQQITATYDDLGRQITLNDPDKGSWQYLNNALGQVVRQEDARHMVTLSTFDHLGRPLTRTTTGDGSTEAANFYYYDLAATVSSNPDLHLVDKDNHGWIGAPQREEADTTNAPGFDAPGTIDLHYFDAKGRPEIELTKAGGQWFYTHHSYDDYSRLQAVRYYWRPPGLEAADVSPYNWQDYGWSYTYDGSGAASKSYVTELRDTSNRVWWDQPTYDYLDRVTSVRKGSGPTTTRVYRPEDGVVTSIKTGAAPGDSQIQNLSFGFDGLGNLTSRANGAASETFGYDSLNRLTTCNGTTTTSYQPNGNILTKFDVAGIASGNYVYGLPQPHAVHTAWGYTYGYDANGNLTSRTTANETWDLQYTGFDKPRWMAKTIGASTTLGSEFHYDAKRSRVMQLEFDAIGASGPTHYVRKRLYGRGPALEANYKNNVAAPGAPVWQLDNMRVYVTAPDGTVGTREFAPNAANGNTETLLVYHHDHLGSIDAITPFGSTATTLAADSSGNPGRYSEDPWGQRRNPFTWSGAPVTTGTNKSDDGGADSLTPRGFTGHEMLDDLGLVHMNGRIYDPRLGRMLSADPLIQDPTSLQEYNRYSYVRNSPLRYTDPSGFSAAAAVPLVEAVSFILEELGVVGTAGTVAGAQGSSAARVGTDPVLVETDFFAAGAIAAAQNRAEIRERERQQLLLQQQQHAAASQVTGKADSSSNAPKPAVTENAPKEGAGGGAMDPNNSPQQPRDPKKDKMAEVRAKGKQGEAQQQEKITREGEVATGKQVTFETSTGRRAKIDTTTTDGEKNIVREAKKGDTATLSSGQKDLKSDVENGRPVIPRGENARKAGYPPGRPTILDEFKEDRF